MTEIFLKPSVGTASRAFKKEARHQAENNIDAHIKEREEELRCLSQDNGSIVFLTTSGMFNWSISVINSGHKRYRYERVHRCVSCNLHQSDKKNRRCSNWTETQIIAVHCVGS